MDKIRKSLAVGRKIACKILTGSEEWPADVRKWADERRSNRQALNRLTDEIELRKSISFYSHINVEKGLEGVMRKLERHKRHRMIVRVTSIAALMALFLSSFLFLSQHSDDLQMNQVAMADSSATKCPELILADGKRVILKNNRQEILSERGILVCQDSSSNLVYSQEQGTLVSEPSFHMLNIPVGTDYFVQLGDGTKVWLNCATILKYPVEFAGKERRVYLDGEAYFDVARDMRHPFIVVTRGVEIKVYGTRFNVNTRTEGRIKTVLESGSVAIRDLNSQEVFLKPNQLGDYNESDGECRIVDVNVTKYTGWKSGEYYFEDESLENIMDELALWYDISLFYARSSAREVHITCCLPKYKEIKDLLSVLESAADIHFEVKGRTVTVR